MTNRPAMALIWSDAQHEAGRAAVEKDTGVGIGRQMDAGLQPAALPNASPDPANVTVTLAVSLSLI
jgi:hypothetical protein